MRLIHGRAKMLKITGQEMGRLRRPRCEEDGLVLFRKANRNRRGSRLRHKGELPEERVQACFAIGVFGGDIAPRFLNGVGACNEVPSTVSGGFEQERCLAFRIMGRGKQHIGVEEEPVHGGDLGPPPLESRFELRVFAGPERIGLVPGRNGRIRIALGLHHDRGGQHDLAFPFLGGDHSVAAQAQGATHGRGQSNLPAGGDDEVFFQVLLHDVFSAFPHFRIADILARKTPSFKRLHRCRIRYISRDSKYYH
jgi:hypothetical protein